MHGSSHRLRLAMKLSAARQPTGNICRLQLRALGWKVGRQIPRDGNKDMPALVATAPFVKPSYARLEHLVGVKAGIFMRSTCASVAISASGE